MTDAWVRRPAETQPPSRPVRSPGRTPAGSGRTAAGAPNGARTVVQLQSAAGNAAVVALLGERRGGAEAQTDSERQVVQRLDAGPGNCPPPPVAPPGITSADDPKFRSLKTDVAGKAKTAKAHPPPSAEVKKAQDAAVAPPDDKEAQAKEAQAEKMAGAKPGGFDKAKFIAAVTKAIEAQRPTTNEEAKDFAGSGKAGQIKSQVAGMVTQGKQDSAKDIAAKTEQAPDPAVAKDKPVTPLPPPAPVPQLAPPDPKKAVPDKAPVEQTELGSTKCELNSKMADADVTEEQLAKSNEPEFTAAVDAKKGAEQHAATAPQAARADEAAALAAATGQADAAGKAGVAGMVGARTTSMGQAQAAKTGTKAKDEQERARISGEIRKIFDGTKTDVNKILGELDGKVAAKFEAGERDARALFEADHKKRMADYEDRIGFTEWLINKFRATKPEVLQIFVDAAATYEKQMRIVISDVADLIGSELDAAKARIAKGRADVAKFVAEQPKALQGIAKDAAQQIGGEFDNLDSSVDAKQDALVDDLAAKYAAAREDVDKRVKELQDENKSWRDKAVDAVAGAIETILKLKNMLLGVLARAAGAVTKIIKDPIGFLGNFISAVKTGVMNFGANILEHLKKGLQGWLFGALADAGIEIPDKFDLKGIVKLILSLLGLTWNAIRARIVKVIPEPVMKVLETSVDFIQAILSEGVVGLWKWIVAKMSDLKEMVMSQIKDFVVTKIITAGITWLISLLNPAAAFIKACKMIYDAVMWFVDNADRLKDFVNSILDSVESIASGGAGAVAGYIEKTLAKTLPMVISGLASLLGLGGISDKIKKVLETVQKPVMSVVDKLVGGAVKVGKKLMAKLKRGGKKAIDSVKGLRDALLAKLKGKKAVTMKGSTHHIYVEKRGGKHVLMMASAADETVRKIDIALGNAMVQSNPTAVANLKTARGNIVKFQGDLDKAMAQNVGKDIRAAEGALVGEVSQIAALLNLIGTACNIAQLRGTAWQTTEGKIHPGIDIRDTFYGGSRLYLLHRGTKLTEAHNEKTKRQATLQPQFPAMYAKATFYCPGVPSRNRYPHLAMDTSITLDHKKPVADHWNNHGRKDKQPPRREFFVEPTNLEALCGPCNFAKGSDKIPYTRKVEPGFEGPDGQP